MTGDCVLVGKILTLDRSHPEAEAVAIRDGRITYVDETREARRDAGPRYWGDRHRDIFLGLERVSRIDPLVSALRRGIRFELHNDNPVTLISPLLLIGTAASAGPAAVECWELSRRSWWIEPYSP